MTEETKKAKKQISCVEDENFLGMTMVSRGIRSCYIPYQGYKRCSLEEFPDLMMVKDLFCIKSDNKELAEELVDCTNGRIIFTESHTRVGEILGYLKPFNLHCPKMQKRSDRGRGIDWIFFPHDNSSCSSCSSKFKLPSVVMYNEVLLDTDISVAHEKRNYLNEKLSDLGRVEFMIFPSLEFLDQLSADEIYNLLFGLKTKGSMEIK